MNSNVFFRVHRGYDFSKSGFGPRTIILCDQVTSFVTFMHLAFMLNVTSVFIQTTKFHSSSLGVSVRRNIMLAV